ncbi:MAG: DUF2183 domain-containing protein [Gammaproteobacteria bacterium]|nr:DUF2183 domain-containing protein [Gammaproteobacteria bacterium]
MVNIVQRLLLLGLVLMPLAAHAERDAIALYAGYGDTRAAVVEGRVIEHHDVAEPQITDSRWSNLKRSVRTFFNDERKGVTVNVQVFERVFSDVTDDEGYFKIAIAATEPLMPGWHVVAGYVEGATTDGALLIVPAENTVGIISDVDDTIQVSDVTDKTKLFKNTVLKNPLQRQPVAGVARFYDSLAARNRRPAAAPVFYLSASPHQLQTSLQMFLQHNAFPRGVLLTKRVTNDSTTEPLTDQVAYKTTKIEEIFARLPHVRFVLIGDDGERDPEIYNAIRKRHPQRVEAVWIRRVHPDPERVVFPEQKDLAQALLK